MIGYLILGLLSFFGLAMTLVTMLAVLVALWSLVAALIPGPKVPLGYNLRNLQARWVTTLFTAGAFTVVVALLAVMLAFVNGMAKLTEGTGNPRNVMIFSDGSTDEAFSNLPPSRVQDFEDRVQAKISRTRDNSTPLFSQEVYVLVTQVINSDKPGSRKRRFVQMRGLEDPRISAEIHDLELAVGRWPEGSQIVRYTDETGSPKETTAHEIVLGDGIAKVFGQDVRKEKLELGDLVDIGPRKWIVVGIMNPGATTFGSEVWTTRQPVADNFGRKNSYSTYVIRVTGDPSDAEEVAKWIKGFRANQTYDAKTERKYYESLSGTNQQFAFAVYFVALVMAIGGILGVMNTMFAAISQRSKDIGVLRMLGYSRLKILNSFMLESTVIAFLGGLLGVALSFWANGKNVSSIVSSGAGGGGKSIALDLVIDSNIVIATMAFSLVMGAIGGFIPALTAMRVKPLESLR